MNRIIVNADDCGLSEAVNKDIEQAIVSKKISSTTIMTNMDDFEGAVRLYKSYNTIVSFGWHINLVEGSPLLSSQILLDKGYYIEKGNHVIFNGKAFWKRNLSKEMLMDIRKELIAQFEKLADNGIVISHADSHHHIHTSPGLFLLMPKLFNDLHIQRIRRIRNYYSTGLDKLLRDAWTVPFKFYKLKMTDKFCAFREFVNNKALYPRLHNKTIELMCHPGFSDKKDDLFPVFQNENKLLMETDVEDWGCKLITYREL